MNKLSVILSILALSVAGCTSPSPDPAPEMTAESDSPPDTQPSADDSTEGSLEDLAEVDVDQGVYDVTVTIPQLFDEVETTQAEIDATVEEEGWISGRLNEDGSTTYVIPSNIYEEYLDEMRASVREASDDLIAEEPNIYKEITFNDTVTKFDVVVDRAEYENAFFNVATFSLGLQGSFFQLFAGVQEENMQVTINYIDDQTGDIFETEDFHDDSE